MTKNEFLNKVNKIHKYTYNIPDIIKTRDKINIICKKHGIFSQNVAAHLRGQGCKKCFNDKESIVFDFYLPEMNICIEYDGIQHFKSVDYWCGDEGLLERQNRDLYKTDYCIKNSIKLIRIKYDEDVIEKLNKNI